MARRRVKTCQFKSQSPTEANGVSRSLLDFDIQVTATGMIMVEESSMMELNDRAAVIGDNV